jgi:hypothetical protein
MRRLLSRVTITAMLAQLTFPGWASGTPLPEVSYEDSNGFVISIQQTKDGASPEFSVILQDGTGETMTAQLTMDSGGTVESVIDGATQITWARGSAAQEGSDLVTVEYAGASAAAQVALGAFGAIGEGATDPQLPTAYSLLADAFLQTHSQQFYQDLASAAKSFPVDQYTEFSWLGCIASVVGYIASFAGFLACATIVGCFGAVALHYVAIASAACSCGLPCV